LILNVNIHSLDILTASPITLQLRGFCN